MGGMRTGRPAVRAHDAALKRPDRKTLGVGSILQLKPQLKAIDVTPEGYLTQVPSPTVNLYHEGGPLAGGYRLPPGVQLRTLGEYSKATGVAMLEVEVASRPAVRGVMHWADVYNNAVVVEEGAPVAEKPQRAKRIQFPDKSNFRAFDELAAAGKTVYGRPFAKVGDTVWIANPSRVMSRSSVGVVKSIQNPEWAHARGLAVVTTYDGKEITDAHNNFNPLTPDEAAMVEPAPQP